MPDITSLIASGAPNPWLYLPAAILLGALHGLEPGHSKTLMAAFIVAIRGTLKQAVLLGLAAAASHTVVVWAVALGGMHLLQGQDAGTAEPYFQLASGCIIAVIALWMLWRTWAAMHADGVHHDHDHDHHHHEDGVPAFAGHGAHTHLDFQPHAGMDDHERAHARDISRRFTGRTVTTGQIVLFGLTGGLIPCPAAITVLLLCLQLKEIPLGAALVLCFSIGLAVTLVAVGAAAALGVRHASQRWHWFGTFARRAPYFSGALILAVGVYIGLHGWMALAG